MPVNKGISRAAPERGIHSASPYQCNRGVKRTKVRAPGRVHFSAALRQFWIYAPPHQMNADATTQAQRSAQPTEQLARFFLWIVSGLALASLALVLASLTTDLNLPGKPGWPEALLIFTATVATLLS